MQIDFETRNVMSELGQCLKITVESMDFCIQEPALFNPKWCSHTFKGPGLCYEVGVCIKTGWIVLHRWGVPSRKMVLPRSAIIHQLEDDEFYVAGWRIQ